MSIDAIVARINDIVAMQQQLCSPASAVGATPAANSTVLAAGATGGTTQSFADTLATAQAVSATAPATSTGSGSVFVPHGGEYGFFPADTANYSAGTEPEIAARLNALGKALHLDLVGISGYRTPQHSVAVGGFADDPHTRGNASDTPGIEGISESALKQFGLTRPFPGAAEADHIQLA